MFSKRLKQLRKQENLTQQEMADFLGITRQGYAKYENNQSESDHDTIKKLACFFNVSTDFLLGFSEDPYIMKDEEFEKFILDLRRWHKEGPKNKDEDVQRLKKIFEAYLNESS